MRTSPSDTALLFLRLTVSASLLSDAGLSFIGLIFLIFCYPEPDGLSLEEVDTLFENGFGIRKSKELRMEKKARLLSAA